MKSKISIKIHKRIRRLEKLMKKHLNGKPITQKRRKEKFMKEFALIQLDLCRMASGGINAEGNTEQKFK